MHEKQNVLGFAMSLQHGIHILRKSERLTTRLCHPLISLAHPRSKRTPRLPVFLCRKA